MMTAVPHHILRCPTLMRAMLVVRDRNIGALGVLHDGPDTDRGRMVAMPRARTWINRRRIGRLDHRITEMVGQGLPGTVVATIAYPARQLRHRGAAES